VLALGLAAELGTLSPEELREKYDELERLPTTLARALKLEDQVIELSESLTVKRRHWAIVGSGSGKIAADEIRIKLSELCYKSIAVDFVEDKKHIDLSSEPLVIVCANGVPPSNVSDLVKEVAIFKAHKSLPIVLVDEGETRFDPYAAGVLRLPKEAGSLSYLVTALVGHLIGYHSARAIDHVSERVRRIRGEVLRAIEAGDLKPEGGQPSESLRQQILELETLLLEAGADSGLGAAAAVLLHAALEFLLGRLSPEALPGATEKSPVDAAMEALTEAVSELARPIDAIKHQAKTVTVGISREQEEQPVRT
jgi:glucosamine--fructose-6-phosphate aminotransferase (isomerizing)